MQTEQGWVLAYRVAAKCVIFSGIAINALLLLTVCGFAVYYSIYEVAGFAAFFLVILLAWVVWRFKKFLEVRPFVRPSVSSASVYVLFPSLGTCVLFCMHSVCIPFDGTGEMVCIVSIVLIFKSASSASPLVLSFCRFVLSGGSRACG